MTGVLNRKIMRNGPIIGTLFWPAHTKQLSAVIVLPGADGGIPEKIAQSIASQGFAVLALAYFGRQGLPHYFQEVPLEYFKKAIEWLKQFAETVITSIALLGYSRGGELALLLGTIFPLLIDGIVAYVPSYCLGGGFPFINRPAWLLDNQPLGPHICGLMSQAEDFSEGEDLLLACQAGYIPYHQNTAKDPYELVDLFHMRHHMQTAAMPIAIEKIDCPLLVISAEDDRIWPSAFYAQQLSRRLDHYGSNQRREFICYPAAGHAFFTPYKGAVYHPVGKFWCKLGGTIEGNQSAYEQAWIKTLTFLFQLKSSHYA